MRHSQLTWLEEATLALILWLSTLALIVVPQWGRGAPGSKRVR
jgi:hypothetical protein